MTNNTPYSMKNQGSRCFKDIGLSRWWILMLIFCGGSLVWMVPANSASAQIRVIGNRGQFGVQAVAGGFAVNSGFDDENSTPIEGGGVVKTDPELESILEKAQRYQADGNYRVATQLWQAVLDRSGDTLYSGDKNQTYYSMVNRVEEVISKLPPEGLNVYRVSADAKAKEILAAAGDPNDVAALSQIVRKYFLSSQGDDAAFRLGALYLENYDFVGAQRLFRKIIDRYPDPSVPLAEVHARQAVCDVFLGELKNASRAVDSARKLNPSSRAVLMVSETLDAVKNGNPVGKSRTLSDRGQSWNMPLRTADRTGVGSSPRPGTMESDLVAIWQYSFDPKDQYKKAADGTGKILVGSDAFSQKETTSRMTDKEKDLLKRWQEKLWRPVGELLLQGDLVVFKSGADLTTWNRKKIESLVEGVVESPSINSFIAWRSVQRNFFQVDDATRTEQSIQRNLGQFRQRLQPINPESPTPAMAADVQLFGDSIFAQMSIIGDSVYSIEGQPFDDRHSIRPKSITSGWNQTYRHTRSNQMVAYDTKTGLVNWRLPKVSKKAGAEEEEDSEWLVDGGFMGAPIGFEGLVIVPVNRGGAIWLYGIDPEKEGKTVWKANLSDEPETGTPAWPSIQLSINGSDLFAACGHGLIFIVDPATGVVRLAKRYERIGILNPAYRRSNWTVKRAIFNGWQNNVVIPYGSQAISFCSDTNVIQAVDRNSGKQVWNCEMTPIGYKVDYLLGVYQDRLYAAGKETIVAFDLKGDGRMIWGAEQLFDGKNSLGRGWLTKDGIFMPVQDKIIQFDLDGNKDGGGKRLATVHVDLGGAPVGNLFCDGNRFWVHNGSRLFVLGTAEEAKKIDKAVAKDREEDESK